jgi:hypothetical protein
MANLIGVGVESRSAIQLSYSATSGTKFIATAGKVYN